MSGAMDVDSNSPSLSSDEYDALPEPIKMAISRHEYAWMDEEMRARLIELETEPEC
jgi:hypothetical protein